MEKTETILADPAASPAPDGSTPVAFFTQAATFHGLWPKKGAIRVGADADFCVLEPGDFRFDARDIRDREDARWSPYHGRALRARVAATWLRGRRVWDGSEVLATPGTGRFVPRQHRETFLGEA